MRRASDPFPNGRYVRVKDVPIFAEHETTARNGRKLKFTKRELERVAARCNRRIKETGDYAMLTVGHTPEPGSGLPSPEVIGFVGPYRMGTLGEPGQRQRYAILANFWVMRKDWNKFEKHPRRSVELWLEDDLGESFLDPIACLGAEPGRLDLGLVTGAKGTDGAALKFMYAGMIRGRYCERYEMAAPAAPSGTNTFIPSMNGRRKKYASGQQPSDRISPAKAREMLHDGTAHGHPLTPKQKRMLGAAVGKEKKYAAGEADEKPPLSLPKSLRPGGLRPHIAAEHKRQPSTRRTPRMQIPSHEDLGKLGVDPVSGAGLLELLNFVKHSPGVDPTDAEHFYDAWLGHQFDDKGRRVPLPPHKEKERQEAVGHVLGHWAKHVGESIEESKQLPHSTGMRRRKVGVRSGFQNTEPTTPQDAARVGIEDENTEHYSINKEHQNMLSPEDLKQILNAFEQLDWVQELKEMLEERRTARGHEGGEGAALPEEEGGGAPPAAEGEEPGEYPDEEEEYPEGEEGGELPPEGEGEEGEEPGQRYGAHCSVPPGGAKRGRHYAAGETATAAAPQPPVNGAPTQYSRVMAEVYQLRQANDRLQKQVDGETALRVNAERRQVLSAWNQHRAMNLTKEVERCKYGKMDDQAFVEHVEAIRDNYTPIPVGGSFPVPEEPGSLLEPPGGGKERYSKEVVNKAVKYCTDQQLAGKVVRYESALEAFAAGRTPE